MVFRNEGKKRLRCLVRLKSILESYETWDDEGDTYPGKIHLNVPREVDAFNKTGFFSCVRSDLWQLYRQDL